MRLLPLQVPAWEANLKNAFGHIGPNPKPYEVGGREGNRDVVRAFARPCNCLGACFAPSRPGNQPLLLLPSAPHAPGNRVPLPSSLDTVYKSTTTK